MSNLVLGRGQVYFQRFVNGQPVGKGGRYLGATPSFSLSGETQELDHYSSEEGLQVKDESVTLRVDYTGTVTLEDINKENLALFFFGTAEDATIAAQPGATEDFVGGPGLNYQLGESAAKPEGVENVSNLVLVLDPDGANTTLVVGTDYTVNLEEGYFDTLAGGAITDGSVLRATYDIAAQTQERVVSSSQLIQGALRFRSRNGVGGQRNFHMPKVTLRPNGEFALKGEEWQNMSFNIEVLQNGNLPNVVASGRGVTS